MVRVSVAKGKKRGAGKRSFSKIRKLLLVSLAAGPKNLNELSKISKVNWRTTRNHIAFLVGMGYVKEIFTSPQVRIFEITKHGMEGLARNAV
ncbi:ArsR family transcriptional regulator [Candidatus Woesearchaeota archaeon]|jgi:predicted transcriptional regulator|nr:ArsR family transcriptional regulator [Candidatus Woesearchaeota archaeon]MBT4247972.1 ArsR family transcriptional regulator [Candidatus Woesearchaeota archaeon]